MNSFAPTFDQEYGDPYKQHINVSPAAWNIIESDMFSFSSTSPISKSDFFNRVYLNFINCLEYKYDQNKLPLPDFDGDYKIFRGNILNNLKKGEQSALSESFWKKYRTTYVKNAKDKYLMKPLGHGEDFRLQKEVLKNLEEKENTLIAEIFEKPGKLLNALYEYYARMQYVDREALFYHDTIDLLSDFIKRKRMTTATSNNRRLYIIPYKICTDSLGTFNYLVAYTSPYDSDYDFKLSSLRISRLSDISLTSDELPLNIQIKKDEIEEILNKRGVQFLLSDSSIIRVRLSKTGINMFKNQLHLRPLLDHIEDENIYCFDCTENQAFFYFFKFGADAEILSPSTLREKFKLEYSRASKLYL